MNDIELKAIETTGRAPVIEFKANLWREVLPEILESETMGYCIAGVDDE